MDDARPVLPNASVAAPATRVVGPTLNDEAAVLPVLSVLADGAPHSRAVLACSAGVSEAEAESALRLLGECGGALRSMGERVQWHAAFIPLNEEPMSRALGGPHGWNVRVAGVVDSTNSVLLREARAGVHCGTPRLLAAELQRAGRGRQGRGWQSSPGASLTVSYALTIARGIGALSGLSLVCGLAVRDVLAARGVAAQLKWPNDVLIDGRKVAGVLIEAHPLDGEASLAVIGVGINVAPSATREPGLDLAARAGMNATDLTGAGAPHVDRNLLATDLASALAVRLARFTADGFGAFQSEWNEAHAFRDLPVDLIEAGRALSSGIARGVDAMGRLLLDTPGGTHAILAGDVSLRARTPATI